MPYLDPAAWPQHLQDALREQGKQFVPDGDKVIAVARLAEQLRMEAEEEIEADPKSWRRVMALQDGESQVLIDRANAISDDDLAYLHAYTGVDTDDEVAAYAQFRDSFRAQSTANWMVRLAYAVVRSIEINGEGDARFNRMRFDVTLGADGGVAAGDGVSEAEWKAWRAGWIVRAIREADFVGLLEEEKAYIESVAQRDDGDELSDATMSTLEYMLVKAQPNAHLINTVAGREEMADVLRAEVRAFISEVQGLTVLAFTSDDTQFLAQVGQMSDEDLTPIVCASVQILKARYLGKVDADDV
jgi:hypothetical protein